MIRRCAADVLDRYERESSSAAFTDVAGSHTQLKDLARTVYGLTVFCDNELPENVLGQLNRDEETISYRGKPSEPRTNFTVAHEIGHEALAHPPRLITDRREHIDQTPDGEALTLRDGVYRSYSGRDRWELEANVFAAELLAPLDRVRERVLADPHWTVKGLARYFGLSRAAMRNQLAAALLPGPASTPDASPIAAPDPDELQQAAITVPAPALVIAGPGAGKTRVLIERIAHLVRTGTQPSRILALTYSNKAAQEMRDRLAEILPEHAHTVRVETFHSFGLGLIHEYRTHLGLLIDPHLLTQIGAFVFLRGRLGELPLGHYEDLDRPTLHLESLLKAISRIKDELATPAEFTALVAEWGQDLDAAPPSEGDRTEQSLAEERNRLAQCVDLAAIYRTYQRWLREEGYLDYGDLIAEPVRLFSIPPVAADIRGRFDQIVVDEFQDINYASGRLLHALDGGRGIVWAVGDPRQSIYRFRGASPVNLRDFTTDYKTGHKDVAVASLEWNYRSVEDIVVASQSIPFPEMMDDALPIPPLRSKRGESPDGPGIEIVVAPSRSEERAALVASIAERGRTIKYGSIAVLCHTNVQAQALSAALEAAGVPTDWGGALEARPLCKDLLGVLLIAADNPLGLVRVARMDEHRLTERDLVLLLTAAPAHGHSLRAILSAACDGAIPGLSDGGLAQVARLKRLASILRRQPTPWDALASYVFDQAAWPRALFGQETPEAQRARVTIGQVATLAREFIARGARAGGNDVKTFIEFLRSCIEAGGLGAAADAPIAAEAVHILTVHRSKGLEWPVVFLPDLVEGQFFRRERRDAVPLPPGLVHGDDPGGHDREQASLFYVAVTRGRDRVVLSYTKQSTGASVIAAPLLAALAHALSSSRYLASSELQPTNAEEIPRPALRQSGLPMDNAVPFHMLKTYDRCPQRFQYEHAYRLQDPERGYRSFRRAIYATLRWIAEGARAGQVPGLPETTEHLAARWAEMGPLGHWLEGTYWRRAERIIQSFLRRARAGSHYAIQERVTVTIGGRTLVLLADEIEDTGDLIIWRRHHFGAPAKTHADRRHEPPLYMAAHTERYGARPGEVRLWYPLNDQDSPPDPPVTPRRVGNRTAKMADFVEKIEAGQFPPKPDRDGCPRCPFVLVCPAHVTD